MQRAFDEIDEAPSERSRSRHPIPDSKFYNPRKARSRSADREGNLNDVLDLFEERIEMEAAGLIESATANGYTPKVEGWNYRNIRGRSAQQLSCRIAFVSTAKKSKLYATYEFFPFLDNKVVPVSPSEKENPARIVLDEILMNAGYNIDESYSSKAA